MKTFEKRLDLWFPKPMESANDMEAETAFTSEKSAYVYVVEPFENGSDSHSLLRSNGRILLYHEAITADECCDQIDALIDNLKELKIKARQKFKA